MKKLVVIILILCLAFAGYSGIARTYTPEFTFTDDKGTVDYEKIYKLHDPEEVIGSVGGKDVTWQEFFYAFYMYARNTEEYINQINTYYGANIGWEEIGDIMGSGESFSEGVVDYTETFLAQYAAIEKYCSEKGIETDAETEGKLAEILDENIASICGQGATEEDFNKALEEMYLPRSMYDRMMEDSVLSEKSFAEVYGENGEKVDSKEAVDKINELGYMHAGHILLSIINPETGETADEDTVKKQESKAKELSKMLKEIEDKSARYEEFLKQAAELTDDGSVEYTFLSGYMVEDFEKAVKELADYEVSDPVKTVYGYHVIIRLPIDADAVLLDQGVSGKQLCAEEEFGDELNKIYEETELKLDEEFHVPDITRYIK